MNETYVVMLLYFTRTLFPYSLLTKVHFQQVTISGTPANTFELSFNGTVVVRMKGRSNAEAEMEKLNTKHGLRLECWSIFKKMGSSVSDWNGLDITKTKDYTGTEFGVVNEAALNKWVKTRKP